MAIAGNSGPTPTRPRFLGIYVNPMYADSEGVSAVLDNIQRAGATAIATTPHTAVPAKSGARIPDLHIDGHDRLLARPVHGQRKFSGRLIRAMPANERGYYGDTPYRPPGEFVPDAPQARLPITLVEEAQRRGLNTYVQVTPFLPPGLHTDDAIRLIDGLPPRHQQVAAAACLNAPAARAYAHAVILETLAAFPNVDGLFMDWAEYPAYVLEDHFSCFCGHCASEAERHGDDLEVQRHDLQQLWDLLHDLNPDVLRRDWSSGLKMLESSLPGVAEHFARKKRIVRDFYQEIRHALDASGYGHIGLPARTWAPPWNRSSGADYGSLSAVCSELTPKLFTFDYNALPRWTGEVLKAWNPDIHEADILAAIVNAMDLPDDLSDRKFADYTIPKPGAPHHARMSSHKERVEAVLKCAGDTPVRPFAHAYLPTPQWREMVEIVRDSAADGMWVQMYGYLSDERLEILQTSWT